MVCFIFSCDLLAPFQRTEYILIITIRIEKCNNHSEYNYWLEFEILNTFWNNEKEKNKNKKCSKIRWLTQAHAVLKTKRLRHNERQIIYLFFNRYLPFTLRDLFRFLLVFKPRHLCNCFLFFSVFFLCQKFYWCCAKRSEAQYRQGAEADTNFKSKYYAQSKNSHIQPEKSSKRF